MQNSITLIAILSVVFLSLAQAEERTWTSTEGKQLQAEYYYSNNLNAYLLIDGKEVKVPLTRLSEEDREYSHQERERLLAKVSTMKTWTLNNGEEIDGIFIKLEDSRVHIHHQVLESQVIPLLEFGSDDQQSIRELAEKDKERFKNLVVSTTRTVSPKERGPTFPGRGSLNPLEESNLSSYLNAVNPKTNEAIYLERAREIALILPGMGVDQEILSWELETHWGEAIMDLVNDNLLRLKYSSPSNSGEITVHVTLRMGPEGKSDFFYTGSNIASGRFNISFFHTLDETRSERLRRKVDARMLKNL